MWRDFGEPALFAVASIAFFLLLLRVPALRERRRLSTIAARLLKRCEIVVWNTSSLAPSSPVARGAFDAGGRSHDVFIYCSTRNRPPLLFCGLHVPPAKEAGLERGLALRALGYQAVFIKVPAHPSALVSAPPEGIIDKLYGLPQDVVFVVAGSAGRLQGAQLKAGANELRLAVGFGSCLIGCWSGWDPPLSDLDGLVAAFRRNLEALVDLVE